MQDFSDIDADKGSESLSDVESYRDRDEISDQTLKTSGTAHEADDLRSLTVIIETKELFSHHLYCNALCLIIIPFISAQIPHLKRILREHGLRVSGNKPDLIQRIVQHRSSSLLSAPIDTVDQDDDHHVRDDDSSSPFAWMGMCRCSCAAIPLHLTKDKLFMSMVAHIQSKHTDMFEFQLPERRLADSIVISKPDLLENMFDKDGQEETLKAYKRYTTIFIIYVLFYMPPDPASEKDDADAPLFTHSNCAAFMRRYKDKSKRYTLRGDNGSTVTSLTMINQEQMVLNGWYVRERESFYTFLHAKSFKDHPSYFHHSIEQGKPASKYNAGWKQVVNLHARCIRTEVESSCVHNSETLKAAARITPTEFWRLVHNLLGKSRPAATRDAALLSSDWSAVARTGDIRQGQFRDASSGKYSIGTEYDVYCHLRNEVDDSTTV